MVLQNHFMEETKDEKNALEAYVYDMRNKINATVVDIRNTDGLRCLPQLVHNGVGQENWNLFIGESIRSDQGAVAVVECVQRRFYGFQYHPEVLRMVYKMVTAPRVHEIRHHILWPKIPHSTATEYKWSSLSMNERIADSAYDGVVLCEIGCFLLYKHQNTVIDRRFSMTKSMVFMGILSLVWLIQNIDAASNEFIVESTTCNQWTERNHLRFGQTVVYMYEAEKNLVVKIRQEDYIICNAPSTINAEKYSNDYLVVKLNQTGPNYSISGMVEINNDKIIIQVIANQKLKTPKTATTPAPTCEDERFILGFCFCFVTIILSFPAKYRIRNDNLFTTTSTVRSSFLLYKHQNTVIDRRFSMTKSMVFMGILSLVWLIQNIDAASNEFIVESTTCNQWTERNHLRFGQTVVYMYEAEKNLVVKIRQEDYIICNAPSTINAEKYSNDYLVVKLNQTGPNYSISGMVEINNDKIIIQVIANQKLKTPKTATTPAPTCEDERFILGFCFCFVTIILLALIIVNSH
ncbi:early nodulin-like protein 9 [Artemisia annua]|uniref:Early nodulin-like protein 9 n=1 Tax=Artemisia annua TaxID=35608 RepID=A0A2U1NHG4_ARTAN|nr:early nodulin-like protein 9 [Artemisia annua]